MPDQHSKWLKDQVEAAEIIYGAAVRNEEDGPKKYWAGRVETLKEALQHYEESGPFLSVIREKLLGEEALQAAAESDFDQRYGEGRYWREDPAVRAGLGEKMRPLLEAALDKAFPPEEGARNLSPVEDDAGSEPNTCVDSATTSPVDRKMLFEFDAWLSMRGEFEEVLRAFRDAFGTDTSAAALDDPKSEYSQLLSATTPTQQGKASVPSDEGIDISTAGLGDESGPETSKALADLIERVERDLHEPDKLRCHLLSARGALLRQPVPETTSSSSEKTNSTETRPDCSGKGEGQ